MFSVMNTDASLFTWENVHCPILAFSLFKMRDILTHVGGVACGELRATFKLWWHLLKRWNKPREWSASSLMRNMYLSTELWKCNAVKMPYSDFKYSVYKESKQQKMILFSVSLVFILLRILVLFTITKLRTETFPTHVFTPNLGFFNTE